MNEQEQEETGPKLAISDSYEDYCDQASLGTLSNIKLKKLHPAKRKALDALNTNARGVRVGSLTAKHRSIISNLPEA